MHQQRNKHFKMLDSQCQSLIHKQNTLPLIPKQNSLPF